MLLFLMNTADLSALSSVWLFRAGCGPADAPDAGDTGRSHAGKRGRPRELAVGVCSQALAEWPEQPGGVCVPDPGAQPIAAGQR